MKQVFSVFILLYGVTTSAQQVNSLFEDPIDGFYLFTQTYIDLARIKTIHVKSSIKDDGVPIKDTYSRRFWHYDELGRLRIFRRKKGFSSDTLRIENDYNESGILNVERKGDIYGRYKTHYVFGQNRIEEQSNERISATGVTNIELTFNYVQHADTLLETIAQTREGKVAYREVRRKTANGLLIYSARLSDQTREERREYFDYDTENRLLKKIVEEKTAAGVHSKTVTRYFYDASGRLGSEREHKNGKFFKRVEYLYEAGLLKAKLEKNGSNGRIVIHEFTYTFFD